jgi:hypothetical protein
VQRGAGAEALPHLAPVELDDVAPLVEERHHQRTRQVLVAALAQDAEPLEPSPDLRAGSRRARRQRLAEGPVGEADVEPLHELRGLDGAPGQPVECVRALLEPALVEPEHLAQQGLVVGRLGELCHGGSSRGQKKGDQ